MVIAGVVGTLCMPWQLLDNLFVFLGYYGAFLSAIGGIMIADYYLLRRRRLNVPELYQMDGQFSYAGGFNPAGLIAWVIAGGLAAWYSQYAIMIGFPLGLILYLLLMKAFVLSRYPQIEMDQPSGDAFLATSVGVSWTYDEGKGFSRRSLAETSASGARREDL